MARPLWIELVAAYSAREHTGARLAAIATAMGYRNASSVSRTCRRVEQGRARSSSGETHPHHAPDLGRQSLIKSRAQFLGLTA